LLVLFVLLTLAAVVVGVFVLRSLGGSQGQQSSAPLQVSTGSVAGRAATTALVSLIDTDGVR
jgi:thiol:disulfide interchange protein